MYGKVLELEVDIMMKESERRGEKRGERRGEIKHAEQTFINMINRNYGIEESIEVSGISKKNAEKILKNFNG